MRINQLSIEKYGKFYQKEIEFEDRVNLIYGKNEAGKSTLYHLIIALFYGFYPANRNDYPYVNWNDDRIAFEATINVKGKETHVKRNLNSRASLEMSSGDQFRKLNNHVIEHVDHVSKNIYENVYSITAESLNMLLGKTWSEIQDKLLFNMGSELLTSPLKIITHLEKQSGELWKNNKRGNQQVRQIDQELRALKQKRNEAVKAYEHLYDLEIQEQKSNSKVAELSKMLMDIDAEIKELKAWIPLKHLIQRQKTLKSKCIEREGIEIELKLNYDIYLKEIANEMADIESQLEHIEKQYMILIQGQEPLLEKEKHLLTYEQEMYQLIQWGQNIELLDGSIEQFALELLELNHKLNHLGDQLFDYEKGHDYIATFENVYIGELIAPLLDLKTLVYQIEALEKSNIQPKSLYLKSKYILIMAMASVLMLVLGFQSGTEILKNAGLIGLGFALAVFFLRVINTNKGETARKNMVEENEKDVKRIINKIGKTFPSMTFKESVLMRMDDVQIKKIEQFFEHIEKVRLVIQKKQQTKEKRAIIVKHIEALNIVNNKPILDYRTYIVQLQNRLDKIREQDKKNSILKTDLSHLNAKKHELEKKLTSLQFTSNTIKKELTKLGYGQLDHGIQVVNDHLNARLQLREIEKDILKYAHIKHLSFDHDEALLIKIENQRQIIHNQLSEQKVLLAEINKDITYIKEDVKMEMILSDIACRENERQTLAVKRDKLILMAELIKVAEEQFRLKNQPDVLKHASRYLTHMTLGKYTQIFVENHALEPSLYVLKSGSKIPIPVTNTFSKGTQQQIFLSLRLALLDHLDKDKVQLPLVLDETFSNWDHERLEPTLKIINEVAVKRQVFLFTCQNDFASRIENTIGIRRLVL